MAALGAAARRAGYEPVGGRLFTAPHLLTGKARAEWLARGFVGVDLETGLLLARNPRGAALRVMLDTPRQELSPNWERPRRVLVHPWLWPETLWLGLLAPRYALRAAAIVGAAVSLPWP